jgi:hypothetical protein
MLSVGITTFKRRFKTYFVPLLDKIKAISPEIEVIVAINGEHGIPLDEEYRSMVLKYIAVQRNVVPIMFPCFRGLAKLWNNIIITASNDYILVLNDDTQITEEAFFQRLIAYLMQNKFRSFKINGCWSHVLLNKWEVDQVGYFDERLLGIGEEDHDFEWRYGKILKREFVSYKLSGIKNCCDMSYAPANIRIGLFNKYSHFNNHFIFNEKYQIDPDKGIRHGAWPERLVPLLDNKNQYPYEKFFRDRKFEL